MSQTLSDWATRYGSSRCAFFIAVIAAAALSGAASRAMAFSNPQDFGRYATEDAYSLGLGGGRYYTGSPADAYSCDSCHSHPSGYSFPLVQKGLPLDGYTPDSVYKIEISSPAATAAWLQAASLDPPNDPVTTLTAELVAENGESAGTISYPNRSEMNNVPFPNLWCTAAKTAPADKLVNEYGMFIYEQDAGSLPRELTAANGLNDGSCTTGRGTDESGVEYERRCIMTLRPCGAQSIKFMWKAPKKWAGTIWFSVGFVTTYDRSTQPNDSDFVTVMTVPLNPSYAGTTHETVLDSGCSVGSVGATPIGSRSGSLRDLGLVFVGLLGFVFARSHRRQGRGSVDSRFAWSRRIALLIVFACIGCSDGKGLVTAVSGPVGAYEVSTCYKQCTLPLICRDSAWTDAGTAESAATARANAMKMAAPAQSSTDMGAAGALGAAGAAAPAVPSFGTVAVQFMSAQPAGLVSVWKKKCPPEMPNCDLNYVAVWIENADKKYVRTLHDQKGGYIDLSLQNYKALNSDCEYPVEVPDVTSQATQTAHALYMLDWDGLFGSGPKPAPAGMYTIKIEVAIDETNHIDVAEVTFPFGDPAPYTMTFPPAHAHAGLTLTYTPGALQAAGATNPTSTP